MTRLTLPVLKQTPHHMASQCTIKADQSLDNMLTWSSLSFTPESSSLAHSLLTFFPFAFSRRSSWMQSRRRPWTGSTGHSWCPSWWRSGCFSASWPSWWDQDPGKESEMGCLCGLAAQAPVSWSRPGLTPLCHPTPVSLHTYHWANYFLYHSIISLLNETLKYFTNILRILYFSNQ